MTGFSKTMGRKTSSFSPAKKVHTSKTCPDWWASNKKKFFLRLFCFLKIACLQWKGLKTNLQKLNLVSNFLFLGGKRRKHIFENDGHCCFFPQKRKAIILKFSYRKESLGKQVKPKELSVFFKESKERLDAFPFFSKKVGWLKRLR